MTGQAVAYKEYVSNGDAAAAPRARRGAGTDSPVVSWQIKPVDSRPFWAARPTHGKQGHSFSGPG